jgi:hypothetical protein
MENKKNLASIIIAVVSTAIIVGVVVYLFVENKNLKEFVIMQKEMTDENAEVPQPQTSPKISVETVKTAPAAVVEPQRPGAPFAEDSKDEMGFTGVVYVTGHAKLEERNEAFCEVNCPKYTYVSFVLSKTENEDMLNFLSSSPQGNSFLTSSSVGLGCLENGVISHFNMSDVYGYKKYTLTTELSDSIISATSQNPVRLKLERLRSTRAVGVTACYSHFTKVDLAQ